jgi:hypothetical protein
MQRRGEALGAKLGDEQVAGGQELGTLLLGQLAKDRRNAAVTAYVGTA